MLKSRIEKLKGWLQSKGVGSFLVTKLVNIRYLTGFTGSSGICFITPEKAVLITDSRYTIQARQEAPGVEVRENSKFLEELGSLLCEMRPRKLAYESDNVSLFFYRKLSALLKKNEKTRSVASRNVIEKHRLLKDAGEIKRICRAVAIAEQAFCEIRTMVRPGICEGDIALELEYRMKRQGAKRAAFDIIVASGLRSALPHAIASNRIIKEGDLVVVDFGCEVDGYHSDITRSFILGRGSSEQRKIYTIVREAQEKSINLVRKGATAKEVDSGARDYIDSHGYGPAFGHGTGHGIGLEVHENPRIHKDNNAILNSGCVFTIEPGIYLENIGGVRIEDMVLVTDDGCRTLTNLSRGPDLLN